MNPLLNKCFAHGSIAWSLLELSGYNRAAFEVNAEIECLMTGGLTHNG